MYPISEVRFADANGSSIAYMTYGDGPVTVCAVPPMAQNIELAWESPGMRAMFDGFASFSRQIMFDKRGTGMSDRSLEIPGLDERVDELKAVMDDAGVDRAFIHGLSEGGPMAIMFAATYPERVEGLILEGTGATLNNDEHRAQLESPDGRQAATALWGAFAAAWGTPDSITTSVFAPSLLADDDWMSWHPRYERHAASRDALEALFEMNLRMDAREVLHRIEAPVLILHRTNDPIIPIEQAHETHRLLDEAGADVTFVELEGTDHFSFAGDLNSCLDAIEQFLTGHVQERPPRQEHRIEISTLGRFEVLVDHESVPISAWGSKRARTLLKRLVAARGWPLTRDELIDLLWPGVASDRLSARLSVQLSAVRRILHGAVIADRETVRLDLDAVEVDIERWCRLVDDQAIIDSYPGDFLPEDLYEDWSTTRRDELRRRFVEAAGRVADRAIADGSLPAAEHPLRSMLLADPFNDSAHQKLIGVLHDVGDVGAARAAFDAYRVAMAELGVQPASYEELAT